VGAVLDQGSCGSCYSFAATAVLEGALVVQARLNLTSLSEQQIISCSANLGCGGGSFEQAWNYSASLPDGGLAALSVYPYASSLGGTAPQCNYAAAVQGVVTTIPGNGHLANMGYITVTNDNQMMEALTNFGPVVCFSSSYFYYLALL